MPARQSGSSASRWSGSASTRIRSTRRKRVIHPVEMHPYRFGRNRVVGRILRRLGQIGISKREDHGRRADGRVRRTTAAGLAALESNQPGIALHLAALIEVVLYPRAAGVVGDEVELVPEPVQPRPALVIEDQLPQRPVVPEVPHHVVIPGAQEAPLVGRVIGIEATALADIERIRKHAGELGERALVPIQLAIGHDEIRSSPPGRATGAPEREAPPLRPGSDTQESRAGPVRGRRRCRRAVRSNSRRCEAN